MKILYLVLSGLFFCQTGFAQSIDRQIISTTGNYLDTGTIKISLTVGEVVIQTGYHGSLIVTQGFHQPDTNISMSLESLTREELDVSAFPNPTLNDVILDFKGCQETNLAINIFNSAGQQMTDLIPARIENNDRQTISFNGMKAGNYFILIRSSDGKSSKVFKVQKMN